MKVLYQDSVWEVKNKFSSVCNGTREYLLKREIDGMIAVVYAGKCKEISEGTGIFIEKTTV